MIEKRKRNKHVGVPLLLRAATVGVPLLLRAATVLRRSEQRRDRCSNQCNISVCIHVSLHFWRKLKWFFENTQY
jgi:hypothetical protein